MSPAKKKSTGPARIQARDSTPGGDWRAESLARVRSLINQADLGIVEEVKWRKPTNPNGVAAWSHPDAGLICTGETYKDKVKVTFAKGASLADPTGLFNASLDGGARRAIDLVEGDKLNATAFKALIRAAVALQSTSGATKKSAQKKSGAKRAARSEPAVKLLSGGNPQIPKDDGEAPVRAYINAMPGWKREVGERIDAIVEKAVPKARKAVRWNSPFYGSPDADLGWFLSFHCITKYVKVAFLNGGELNPAPPVKSKHPRVRYLHIHEGEAVDEKQFTAWVKQASKLMGEGCF